MEDMNTVVTLEAAWTALTTEEQTKLALDPKAMKEFRAKYKVKKTGHKEAILAALQDGPKTDVELSKVCDTTVKTIQSYICYLNDDAKMAERKEAGTGQHIMLISGKRTLLTAEMKRVLGIA